MLILFDIKQQKPIGTAGWADNLVIIETDDESTVTLSDKDTRREDTWTWRSCPSSVRSLRTKFDCLRAGETTNVCRYWNLEWTVTTTLWLAHDDWRKEYLFLVSSTQAYACMRRIEFLSHQALPLWGIPAAATPGLTPFLLRPFMTIGVAFRRREGWRACSVSSKSSSMEKVSSNGLMAMVKKNFFWKARRAFFKYRVQHGLYSLVSRLWQISLLPKKAGGYEGGYLRLKTFASVVCLLPISLTCGYRPNVHSKKA